MPPFTLSKLCPTCGQVRDGAWCKVACAPPKPSKPRAKRPTKAQKEKEKEKLAKAKIAEKAKAKKEAAKAKKAAKLAAKKEKKKKNGPKRPLTPFFRFAATKRDAVKKTHPASVAAQGKALGDLWNAASTKVKQPFIDAYNAEMAKQNKTARASKTPARASQSPRKATSTAKKATGPASAGKKTRASPTAKKLFGSPKNAK